MNEIYELDDDGNIFARLGVEGDPQEIIDLPANADRRLVLADDLPDVPEDFEMHRVVGGEIKAATKTRKQEVAQVRAEAEAAAEAVAQEQAEAERFEELREKGGGYTDEEKDELIAALAKRVP